MRWLGVSTNPPVPMCAPGEKPQQPNLQCVRDCFHNLVKSQVELRQVVRINLHLQHLQLLAPDGNIRDSGNAQQCSLIVQ